MKNALLPVLAAVLLVFTSPMVSLGQVTLVNWTFPSTSADATVDVATASPANTTKIITQQRSTTCGSPLLAIDYTITGADPSPDKCATANNWSSGSGCKYWEVEVNTTGYGTLKVSSKQRSSNTGPKDFKLQYKIGAGGTYTDVTGGAITVGNNNFTTGVLTDLALPVACDGQASVFLRWIMTSNNAVSGSLADAGTSRIDDILVTGIATSSTPTVSLSVSANAGSEAGATVITATATTSAAVSGAQTVSIAASGAGITAGDYTLSSNTITIANGATTGTVTFTIVDDAVYECTETATLTISSPSSGMTLGAITAQNITITDNDFPTVNLSINTATSSEAASTSITLTATASAAVIGAQTVSVALSGTGLTNADFSGITFPATITIANGATTGTRTFTIFDDSAIEGDENATFTISSPSSCVSLGATTTQGLTIVDNDFPAAPCADLFISEYVEGSSNNKYIEIYNPTSSAINLATGIYSVRLYSNGASSPSNEDFLTGTLPAYSTLVLANASASIYSGSTTSSTATGFNGDDALALAKNGTNIDIFGRIGDDPGTAWTAGATHSTLDKTLVRNASVQVGIDANPTGTGAGAFTTLSTEWTQFNIDVVSNLGSHTCNCFVANPSVNLSINPSTGTEAASTSITLTATASSAVSGNQTVQVSLSGTGVANSDFAGVTFPATITILNGATTGTLTFTIFNDVLAEGDETATFTIGTPSSGITIGSTFTQNLTITDDDNLTSSESRVVNIGGEAVSISSLSNGTISTSSQGTQVWQFRLFDGNGTTNDADTKPTIYKQWVIRPSAGNTVPDWTTVADNVKFFLDGSTSPIPGAFLVNPSNISFLPSTAITIADGSSGLISMRLTVDNPMAAGSDGRHFGFSIVPADVTVETDVLLSSQLGTFTVTSNGALNEINVNATLQFINAPATVGLGDAFTITISAIDANGNIDSDNNSLITLAQNSGTGVMTGGSSANLVNGTYTWTGLSYNTEEVFQVRASGGGFAQITANINVVDEDFQLFDHFNRADGYVVGVPSSGGSTSWTETEAGDGTRIRIFNGMLMLDNCNASDPSGSSGGTTTERVSFNAENHFETIYNSAGGTLNWLFNMRTNNATPSGWNGSAYGMAFILGCNQADVTAAGSNGYAVVVGNPGSPDYIKLVRFTNGLNSDANVTDIVLSTIDIGANHASVKVSFNPCTGQWTLYARNDGASFILPNLNSPAYAGPFTATNTTHTALDLKFFGAAWKHNSSCVGNDAYFDNFSIPNVSTASSTAKNWNGSVNSNWNVAGNWGPCPGVPTATDNVIIPNVATQPVISAAPAGICKNLTLNTGASVTINAAQFLNVRGNVVNNGSANFGAGTLSMEGGAVATLTGAVTVANFHVSSPVTLNSMVTVSNITRSETGGALAANGNLTLLNGAQLLHGAGTTNGGGSVSGNVIVKRQGSNSGSVYNYWSTPVATATVPGSTPYYYNSNIGTQDYGDDFDPDPGWFSFSGNMALGQGYASTGGGLATFTGTPNNGNVPYSLTYYPFVPGNTAPGTPFNLVGNPYPGAVSASAFVAGNANINGALYFWDDDLSGGSGYSYTDYAIWNGVGTIGTGAGSTPPNGQISSCQGFLVRALSASNITFTNAMRSGGNNGQFFKPAEEPSRLWLALEGNDQYNEILIGMLEDATEGEDRLYDAVKLRGNTSIALASINDGYEYAILAFPPIPTERIVPLVAQVVTAGTYSFNPHTMEGFDGYDVYLEDRLNATWTLIQEALPIQVALTAGENIDRFYLHFSPFNVTSVADQETSVELKALIGRGEIALVLTGGESMVGSLEMISANGQVLSTDSKLTLSSSPSILDMSNLSTGVYLIRFISENRSFVTRFIKN